MIEGRVNDRLEAVVPLALQGGNGVSMMIEAIIDTGFSGYISLPSRDAGKLGPGLKGGGTARLADGAISPFDICEAYVEWHGHSKKVIIAFMGEETLMGSDLLSGSELKIEFAPGGLVQIIPLDQP